MKKKLIIFQDGNKECGSACLLSIIRYYNGDMPISKIVELTKTDKKGTNFYNMQLACNELGLIAKGYKVDDIKMLSEINKPFIVQIINNNYSHFVVVYKFSSNKIIIMDPAKGKTIISAEKFKELFTGNILMLEPYKKLPIFKSDNYLLNIVIELLLKNKKLILNLTLLSIIFTILTCLYSFYFKIIIDDVLGTTKLNLVVIVIIFLIIIIIKNVTNYTRNYLLIFLNQKIDLSVILNTFKKILLLPYNYYKSKTTGEVISRINDLTEVKSLITKIFVVVFLDLFITLIGGIFLYLISPKMFGFLIIICIFYIIVFYIFRPSIKKMTSINQENNAKINSLLVESIGGFESIKGLNMEKTFENKMERLYIKGLEDILAFDKINNIENLLKDLIEGIGLIVVTYVGCTLVLEGELTIGSLITFNSLLVYFVNPVRSILDTSKEYYFVSSSIKRANNLFNIEVEKIEEANKIEVKGDIKIQNLNFTFNTTDLILKDISLSIKEGEKVLILGKSGSGKSTLLKLLYQYYTVGRNNIYINNFDICNYCLSDIRKNIGYISQNETIYTDSIRNNIILERDITEEEYLKICEDACIAEILSNTVLGDKTLLEENGVNLSGGQRQRIILARMLLKKSNILLIDEGLNQIDINMERKILKNIFNCYKDKTIVIVSHRLDNLDLYDKVIKMNNGEIEEVIERNTNEKRTYFK